MGILLSVLTVLFGILCVLLVIVILLQSDKSAGMGILGGSSSSAFGSSTADVITKITAVMVGIFMMGSLGLAVMESKKSGSLKEKSQTTGTVPSGSIEKTAEGDKTPGIESKETNEDSGKEEAPVLPEQ